MGMKISKKRKRKLKKRMLQTLGSLAIVTCTLATLKLAKFSMPFEKVNHFVAMLGSTTSEKIYDSTDVMDESKSVSMLTDTIQNSSEKEVSSEERLPNTDTVTYLYDAQDLVAFRDKVNAGDSYAGKTVYVMADIDMSSICSETVGTWEPIGVGNSDRFAGTFDGNYHTISNLYINSNSIAYTGLFHILSSTGIVQNIIMKNVSITNTYNVITASTYVGAIAAQNDGRILNCGVESGSIIGRKTAVNTTANSWPGPRVGGIVGYNYGTVSGCYNKATIEAYSSTSNTYNEIYVGGIVGANLKNLENCYNLGRVTGSSTGVYMGGIAGHTQLSSGKSGYFKNSYNYGTVVAGSGTYKCVGGIVGRSGWSSSAYAMPITNCFTTNNVTYSYVYWNGSKLANSTAGRVASDTLKTYTVTLGSAFAYDVYNQNAGYPVLAWQNETAVMSFDKNQAYIKVNETLPLHILKNDEIGELIQNNYDPSNFQWTSTNEEVATVDENGLVTGRTDGYTTVYAYHKEANLYAMAIVNVANHFTNPQIGTGNGFTVILKADGTVWTVGNNKDGQLGNGTNQNSKIPQKVHMDEDTQLANVIKIAVGTDHVLALTQNGKVYSWGLNDNGQLGSNDTNSSAYAKAVLGEDGTNYLTNIVDISAGAYGSVAIDKDGNLYVWGKGSDGQIGNGAKDAKYLPTKNTIQKAIQVSMSGRGSVSVLTAEGVVWSWGYNGTGLLGINCLQNTSYPMKTALNVMEVSFATYHSVIKKVDGMLYGAGENSVGRLGMGKLETFPIYTKLKLPQSITQTNPVKYFHVGRANTSLLLADGTIWETGQNGTRSLGKWNQD